MEVPNNRPWRLRKRIPAKLAEWSDTSHLQLLPTAKNRRYQGRIQEDHRDQPHLPSFPRPPPPTPLPTHKNATIEESSSNSTSGSFSDVNADSFRPWYYFSVDGSGSNLFHRRTSVVVSESSVQLLTYIQFLGWMLSLWAFYLLLPKGLRKAYCRADRRRHKRHRQVALLPTQKQAMNATDFSRPASPPLNISVPRIHMDRIESVDARKQTRSFNQIQEPQRAEQSLALLLDGSNASIPADLSRTRPYHPAILTVPAIKILRDTFDRLEHAGIRLIAHGIQCDSKRVWIRMIYDRSQIAYTLKWQTEVCQTMTSLDGRVSQVWVKRGGAGHTLPMEKVLCVDVGKNTSALSRKAELDPDTCFSLLTPTGSLDLQARSRLERDAIVCCLSRVLDEVHDVDWRQLYQESPEPSTVTSALQSTVPPSTVNTSDAVARADSSIESSFL